MSLLDSPLLAGPAWLETALLPLCTAIGLPALASVAHITIIACLASFTLQRVSRAVSPRLFPARYPTLEAKKSDWDLHIVGWVFSLIASPMAISLILNVAPEIKADPLFGYGVREGRLSAFATGYFIWDAFVSAKHIRTQGLGFFLHGLGCGLAFLFTLRPYLLSCGPNFLIWELSTVFLNVHWFLDKFGMTGSKYQLVNGVLLLSAYVGARLIWGSYQSYGTITLLFGANADPRAGSLRWLYGGLSVLTNALNWFWFRSMVLALRKRFVKAEPGAHKEAIQVDGKLRWGKDRKEELKKN